LLDQVLMRIRGLCDKQQTGCVLVQSVNYAGSNFSSDAFQVRAVVQEGIYQGTNDMTGRWMDDDSGWFVQNQNVGVFKNNI